MPAAPAARKKSARRARSTERRRQIIEATIRLVAREGTGGLTHRKVAREAGVPLAATTYYFDSKEALLQETLVSVAEEEIARLQSLTASAKSGPETIRWLLDAFVGEDSPNSEAGARTQLAQYELFLEAARRPKIRAVAREWTGAYLAVAEMALAGAGSEKPAVDARILVAMLDGLFLQQVATRSRSFEKQILEPALRRFTEAIATPS
jgi:DNA-binding transcriptional regulator YbjK